MSDTPLTHSDNQEPTAFTQAQLEWLPWLPWTVAGYAWGANAGYDSFEPRGCMPPHRVGRLARGCRSPDRSAPLRPRRPETRLPPEGLPGHGVRFGSDVGGLQDQRREARSALATPDAGLEW